MPAPTEIEFLPDYCPTCCPAGHYADRCDRLAALTEPDAVTWSGGPGLRCDYICDRCGHRWRRTNLWTAAEAGFRPTQEDAA